MQTHDAKRVAIVIEQVMLRRLTEALESADVTGWTVLPVLGGSGRSGAWHRDDQITRGAGLVQVLCLVRPEKLDALLEAAFKVVDRHIGVVSVSDAQVVRADRF